MICGTPTRASALVAGLDCRLSAVCSVTPRQPRRHAMLTWITIHCGAPRRPLAEGLRRRWKARAQWSRSGAAPKVIVEVAIHVRFTPESGHVRCNEGCPLWANSGHHLFDHLIGTGEH